MALQPGLILAGQQFDLAGSMGAGNQLAAQTNQLRDQNALRDVYRTQGAGILQGNQQSLNALAAVDPNLAINAQGGVLSNQTTTRQLEIINAEEKRAIAEAARNMDEAQKAEALKATQQQVLKFVMAPDASTFDRMVTEAGKPELAGMFDQRQRLGALYMDDFTKAFETAVGPAANPAALTEGAPAGKMWVDPTNRALGVKDLPGAGGIEWRDATPQEAARYGAAAGQISTKTGAFKPFNPPRNTTTEVGPDGTLRIIQGPGNGGKVDVGDAISPAGIDEAKNLITDILKTDPKTLARITGSVAGGGGNNVDELGAPARLYYGDDGVATIEKLGQLGSQAWFAARDMLKGGGQITDYESKKAEAAVARLSRTKSPEDLKAALQELLDAIQAGEEKLRAAGRLGSVADPAATPPAAGDLSDDDLLKLYGADRG